MAYDFNADEIFEMAGQLERNGAEFYKTASEKVEDASAKTLTLELAAMELEHEKTFAEMRGELTDRERESTVFDPDGESAAYLRALADTRVFFEKEIDMTSLREILKAAITAEKDSIVFYLGMKEMIPEKGGKDRIDSIIKEEMGHIRMLAKKLKELEQRN